MPRQNVMQLHAAVFSKRQPLPRFSFATGNTSVCRKRAELRGRRGVAFNSRDAVAYRRGMCTSLHILPPSYSLCLLFHRQRTTIHEIPRRNFVHLPIIPRSNHLSRFSGVYSSVQNHVTLWLQFF